MVHAHTPCSAVLLALLSVLVSCGPAERVVAIAPLQAAPANAVRSDDLAEHLLVVAALIRGMCLQSSSRSAPSPVVTYLAAIEGRAWITPRPEAMGVAHWMLYEALQELAARDPERARATAQCLHRWLQTQLKAPTSAMGLH